MRLENIIINWNHFNIILMWLNSGGGVGRGLIIRCILGLEGDGLAHNWGDRAYKGQFMVYIYMYHVCSFCHLFYIFVY